ncbi:MAG: bile acid:sodium symporter family protein [Rhizobiaceae bacterium]
MKIEDEKFLAALALAMGVVVAFYFDGFAELFVPLLLPSLFFVMTFSLLPYVCYGKETFTKLHPAVLPLVGLQQFVLPGATGIVGMAMNVNPEILFFILVTVTSGSLFASPTLINLMGLDQRMAVQTVVVSTLAAPISIYMGFSIIQGGAVAFDFVNFGIRLAVFLGLPVIILICVRQFARNWTDGTMEMVNRTGRWGSVISLIIFGFALEAPVKAALKTDGDVVLLYLGIAIVFTSLVAVVTKITLGRYGREVAMTAAVLASFRNIGLTFGLVGTAGVGHLSIYVGASQIPMFFAPLLFEFFFGRHSRQSDEGTDKDKLSTVDGAKPLANAATEAGTTSVGQELMSSKYNLQTSLTAHLPSVVPLTPGAKSSSGVLMSSGVTSGANMVVSEPAKDETTVDEEVDSEKEGRRPTIADKDSEPVADDDDARGLRKRLEDRLAAEPSLEQDKDAVENQTGLRFSAVAIAAMIAGLTAIWHGNKYFAPMLFDHEMIERVAETHIEGRNFGVFDLNINIRDLRNETIKRLTKTPEVGILGASHWQEAHTSLLSGVDLYNSHIHRDYYEDMMAMVEIYERHDRLPKNLIITIRDKLLTPVADRTDFLWLPGIKYYRDFAARVGYPAHSMIETLPVQTWRELLNWPLLKTHGSRHLMAPVMPHATDKDYFETLDVLLPGGSIKWSQEHLDIFTQQRARDEALAFAEVSKNSPPKIDPKGVEHMEFLFQYLKDKGVNVTLAHPQFNPVFWDEVQGTDYMVGLKRIEDLTQSWADKYGFGYVGGFRPEQVGCKAEQYIDAEHGDPACLGMLLMQYRFQDDSFKLRGTVQPVRKDFNRARGLENAI